jgi:hypothetical protein
MAKQAQFTANPKYLPRFQIEIPVALVLETSAAGSPN